MLIIGLTGGIGSGKSAVAELFTRRGVPIVDSDVIARELVRPGQPALAQIAAHFGPSILDGAGNLDRRALRNRVFSNPEQRRALEQILHPPIMAEMHRQAAELSTADYCIFVIPLLVECGLEHHVDRILVIDADPALRRQRIKLRDGLNDAEIDAVFATQTDRRQRLASADDVIHNNGDWENLDQQVEKLHQRYRASARRNASQKNDNSVT